MAESLSFWTVDCAPGDPDLFVCMSCLDEVFKGQVPVQGCPGCQAVSTFEPFDLDAIRAWGTESLISKATGLSLTGSPAPSDSPQSVE
jgi:hypothetical protein